MKRFIWLFLLATLPLVGQEIKIVAPSTPIERNNYAVLTVIGLSDNELPRAKVTTTPSTGVEILTNRPWSGYPYLQFRSSIPGRYSIDITLNGWRTNLDDALQQAKAAGIDEATVAELQALATKVATNYPLRLGTASVEVAGGPFVPPGPDPPTPTPGRKRVVILLERGQTTPDQARLITSLQSGTTAASKYLVSKQHFLMVLDDDHPSAQVWLPKLGTVAIPAVIISDAASSAVSSVASLPTTADAVVELVKKAGG